MVVRFKEEELEETIICRRDVAFRQHCSTCIQKNYGGSLVRKERYCNRMRDDRNDKYVNDQEELQGTKNNKERELQIRGKNQHHYG